MYPLTYCSYGGARENNHGWSVVHFTEDANRHFVFENPPPPPAKNLTRNELRLFELSRLSWSERQPTPQPQTYCRQQTLGRQSMTDDDKPLGSVLKPLRRMRRR